MQSRCKLAHGRFKRLCRICGLGSQQGTVSPSNEWVFTYDSGNGAKRTLRTITPEGVQRDLTPSLDVGQVPAAYWSPDGTRLAFVFGSGHSQPVMRDD